MLEKTNREYDKLRLYIRIDPSGIEGIKPAALWEYFKTYFRYFNSLEKLAIVGTGKLEENIMKIAKPFISGDDKYFSVEEASEAKKWIEQIRDIVVPIIAV